jgi:uncharacterized repeat protein (TIGR03843 family)
MTNAELVEVLTRGEIEVLGRIVESSNQALLVEVTWNETTVKACYKTELGERPLWDFPGGLWRREVAAWVLSDYLGLDLIPITVARDHGPFGPGSLQRWIEETTGDHYFTLSDREDLEEWFQSLVAFDLIANNTDRKSGHVIFDGHRCWAIDQGLCFGEEEKVRTVMWDFGGFEIGPSDRSALERALALPDDLLAEYLNLEEIGEIRHRAASLLENGYFPEPDEDREWPPYPWPLV